MNSSQSLSSGRRGPGKPVSPKLPKTLTLAMMPADDFEDEKTLKLLEYQGADLSGRTAEGFDVEQCRFEGSRLAECVLGQVIVSDSVFGRCDFANFRGATISLLQSSMSDSRLTGTSWARGLFRDVRFTDCRADLAHFRYAKFKSVAFEDCDLRQADFQWSELRGVLFTRCDLQGGQFANATMQNVRFEDCVLVGVGGVMSFKGATVRSGDLLSLAASLAREIGIDVEE